MGSMRCGRRWRPRCRWACEKWCGTNITVRRRLHDTYFDAAHSHIFVYAAAAGGAGAIPVPYIDVPVVLAVQAKLFHTIGAIYGQPMNAQQMATIASGLGIGYAARFGIRELAKLIPVPGVGSAISGVFAMASTYALGIALCEYFGHLPGRQRAGCQDVPRLVPRGLRRSPAEISEATGCLVPSPSGGGLG